MLEKERPVRVTGKNKGEWVELYCLLQILAQGHIPVVGSDRLRRLVWVERADGKEGRVRRYSPGPGPFCFLVSARASGEPPVGVALSGLEGDLQAVFGRIKAGKGAFPIPEAGRAMGKLGIERVSTASDAKCDVVVKFYDGEAGGYWVKSPLCGDPSIFNAGSATTRLRYRVESGPDSDGKRLKALFQSLREVQFDGVVSPVLRENLEGVIPEEMLGMAVQRFLCTKRMRSVKKITEALAEERALGRSPQSWRRNIRRFLRTFAVDGVPGTPLPSSMKGHPLGVLLVQEDGLVELEEFRTEEDFEDHLYERALFDGPAAPRHSWGGLKVIGGQEYVDYVIGVRIGY